MKELFLSASRQPPQTLANTLPKAFKCYLNDLNITLKILSIAITKRVTSKIANAHSKKNVGDSLF